MSALEQLQSGCIAPNLLDLRSRIDGSAEVLENYPQEVNETIGADSSTGL